MEAEGNTIEIRIPTPLRPYTDGDKIIELKANTVGQALSILCEMFPRLKPHLFDDQENLRNFVNVYVNDNDIRYSGGLETELKTNDTVLIIPSIAGGVDINDSTSQALAAGDSNSATQIIEHTTLSKEEIERYSRHLILPEVGIEGQKRLKNAKVLIVGAGGLGSPISMYLAAAGVGTIGLVDFDVVDYTNLQRQLLHTTNDIGRNKLESAKETLLALNPHISVKTHETVLSSDNALQIISQYDMVIDGTDNFPTRYLINDACVFLGKPNIYGSIFRFEGQVTVFDPKNGPCYRCLYPEPPPPGLVPSCAEGGVLGVLPGMIGTIQANEAIKLIIGKGDALIGRLLLLDALEMRFRELKIRKNPDCVVCGKNPSITELIDYDEFCGVGAEHEINLDSSEQITVKELAELLDSGVPLQLVDVRNPDETEINQIPKHILMPLNNLESMAVALDKEQLTVLYCKTGVRSLKALVHLKQLGFKNVKNLVGGVTAWVREIDPSQPLY